jgi:tetraprenyl-beta-curcumene synthase
VRSAKAADAIATVLALALYERRVVPLVRHELDRWVRRAATIPDPALREAALSSLRDKGGNTEATAVFAIIAPSALRARTLRAISALQIAIDYLDSLGETAADDSLADGLALHGAICDAVSADAPAGGWYDRHPRDQDGGYLAALVAACREELAGLPARDATGAALRRAARRCGEGQSHTHSAATVGGDQLERWAGGLRAPPGYLWWELAAGASSSVAAHALIAAAADSKTTAEEAELIDAAYFPPIGALTVLLDDLVDYDEDLGAKEHNYLSYCAGAEQAAARIGLLAARARAATAPLRARRRHRAILVGVAGFYLSDAGKNGEYARPIGERLLEALGPAVRVIMVALRLRRHG